MGLQCVSEMSACGRGEGVMDIRVRRGFVVSFVPECGLLSRLAPLLRGVAENCGGGDG